MEVVKLKVTLDQVVALVILRKDLGAESHYLAVPISVPVAQRLIQSLAPIQSLEVIGVSRRVIDCFVGMIAAKASCHGQEH